MQELFQKQKHLGKVIFSPTKQPFQTAILCHVTQKLRNSNVLCCKTKKPIKLNPVAFPTQIASATGVGNEKLSVKKTFLILSFSTDSKESATRRFNNKPYTSHSEVHNYCIRPYYSSMLNTTAFVEIWVTSLITSRLVWPNTMITLMTENIPQTCLAILWKTDQQSDILVNLSVKLFAKNRVTWKQQQAII